MSYYQFQKTMDFEDVDYMNYLELIEALKTKISPQLKHAILKKLIFLNNMQMQQEYENERHSSMQGRNDFMFDRNTQSRKKDLTEMTHPSASMFSSNPIPIMLPSDSRKEEDIMNKVNRFNRSVDVLKKLQK